MCFFLCLWFQFTFCAKASQEVLRFGAKVTPTRPMFGNTKERSFTGLIVGFERFLRMNMDDDECIGQNLDHGVYTVMTQDCKHIEMTLQCD